MKQLKTYQFKLKPTKKQEQVFGQWLGTCRYVYNLCLDYKKISLVEIVYALVHTGSLRVGRARTDIKELTAFFEKHFHIELGDVYRTFLEIKGRSQQTKFLDVLRNTLKNKIEEDEK
jgi:transposase